MMMSHPTYEQLENVKMFTSAVSSSDLAAKIVSKYFSETTSHDALQIAVGQIAPAAFSIIFSIPDLLLSGYLISSETLLRSVLDRVSTIAWLRQKGPGEVKKWEQGWKNRARPKLHQKVACLDKYVDLTKLEGMSGYYDLSDHLLKNWVDRLNGSVHGDTADSMRNAVWVDKDLTRYIAGPNLLDSKTCSEIANLGLMITCQFIHELGLVFPLAFKQREIP